MTHATDGNLGSSESHRDGRGRSAAAGANVDGPLVQTGQGDYAQRFVDAGDGRLRRECGDSSEPGRDCVAGRICPSCGQSEPQIQHGVRFSVKPNGDCSVSWIKSQVQILLDWFVKSGCDPDPSSAEEAVFPLPEEAQRLSEQGKE